MKLQNVPIDYEMLAKAVKHYKNMGYEQIEIPWVVSQEASMTTAPTRDGVFQLAAFGGDLIGSAEQGFIEMMLNKSEEFKAGYYYFAISPCFRWDEPSEIYSQWFMKLELFVKVKNVKAREVMNTFLTDAEEFFTLNYEKELKRIKTSPTSVDLMYGDLELGSYGYRTLEGTDIEWVYGTGLALPRAQLLTNR